MAKYSLVVNIESASGTQMLVVEADSREEALAAYNRGEGDIVAEEIEVGRLRPATLADVEEYDELPYPFTLGDLE